MTKDIRSLVHTDKRKNIPTAEYQSIMQKTDLKPIQASFAVRNLDADPQLIWSGKSLLEESQLDINVPPLYIQEKVHPKQIIDGLVSSKRTDNDLHQVDLFADFNGLPNDEAKTEFYQHDGHWTNRMILGDSLLVMASLLEKDGLKDSVQCIYFDPPYGIKFNSNFQWSTNTKDVKDGKIDHITREPEQVKAFRDTWKNGIHSYLTYLRDRLIVSRELLSDTGSIFVQIGDENLHRVRTLLDEVFGEDNFISQIAFKKTVYQATDYLPNIYDHILWYGKNKQHTKVRKPLVPRSELGSFDLAEEQLQVRRLSKKEKTEYSGTRLRASDLTSKGASEAGSKPFIYNGKEYSPKKGNHWKTHTEGLGRLVKAQRLIAIGNTLCFKKYASDSPYTPISNVWNDTVQSTFASENIYVVQTYSKVVSRCISMASDPGDLVVDPTCGAGTTAFVSEQLGRRWITVDTSRVALALARARLMGAKFPYYLLSDSLQGAKKEAEISGVIFNEKEYSNRVKMGFVYERAPRITLKAIANNTEIDVIYDKYREKIAPQFEALKPHLNENAQVDDPSTWGLSNVPEKYLSAVTELMQAVEKKLDEINKSVVKKSDYDYLYSAPYYDKNVVRVAGPFTLESISPHRALAVDEDDNVQTDLESGVSDPSDFAGMIIENLKVSGVQQGNKEDKIKFDSIEAWPGKYICAQGSYEDEQGVKRAGILIGSEFGTVTRPDLVEAAREAADADFDSLITFAFNYDAHSSDFSKLGRIPVLKARINADMHMADDLRNTGKGNLFVIFGEPDIDIISEGSHFRVKINGVDVFQPNTGEIRSDDASGIACWMIDTNYNQESFYVRHAYFLGANDPYKSLKTALKSEISKAAWEELNSNISRPFSKPETGRIAVKVINHLGDEVMKVYRVE